MDNIVEDVKGFLREIDWMTCSMCFFSLVVTTVLLHLLCPARSVVGYACDKSAKPLTYRLNGLRVLVLVVSMYGALVHFKVVDPAIFAKNLAGCAIVANIFAFVISSIYFVIGQRLPIHLQEPYSRCSTRDNKEKPKASAEDYSAFINRSFLGHFFIGQEFNPRIGGAFDVKMYLYLFGAVCLELNVLSLVALQYENDKILSQASLTSGFMLSWFVTEYMFFEEVHLYTYDVFAEKLGHKLFFGCFCFYPYFYSVIPMWTVVNHQHNIDMSKSQSISCLVCFFLGWVLTRGANMQKFYFKRCPEDKTCFCGLLKQETIPKTRLLTSGFWGLSRHVNYLGEVIQALAIALPGMIVSGSFLSLAYPLYYVFLLIDRQREDDRICSRKYGGDWKVYQQNVPYRIIPFVY